MKIGILSDNHGHLGPMRSALELLETLDAEAFVHCGDLGGLATLELLAGHPTWFVWGNTDYPEPTWEPVIRALDMRWPNTVPVLFELEGLQMGVCHGHEVGFQDATRLELDYLFHGHTHQAADRRIGKTRVINPGALFRARERTVALLDLGHDELSFHSIEDL
jgi:hypothetical protein